MTLAKEGFQAAGVDRDDFAPAPIPTADVLEGEPVTRSCDLSSSRDRGLSMNLWDCTSGRFSWHYYGDELVHILEGEVRVTDEDGHLTILRSGSTAHFAAGDRTVWEVPEYVKKLAIHRTPTTLPQRVMNKLRVQAERARRRRQAPEPIAQEAGDYSLV